jgi:hypothetical protein
VARAGRLLVGQELTSRRGSRGRMLPYRAALIVSGAFDIL